MCDQGSLAGLCVQDNKPVCATVTICATLVNIQTQRPAIWIDQPAELKITIAFQVSKNYESYGSKCIQKADCMVSLQPFCKRSLAVWFIHTSVNITKSCGFLLARNACSNCMDNCWKSHKVYKTVLQQSKFITCNNLHFSTAISDSVASQKLS